MVQLAVQGREDCACCGAKAKEELCLPCAEIREHDLRRWYARARRAAHVLRGIEAKQQAVR
jgi:hypothetical protein